MADGMQGISVHVGGAVVVSSSVGMSGISVALKDRQYFETPLGMFGITVGVSDSPVYVIKRVVKRKSVRTPVI